MASWPLIWPAPWSPGTQRAPPGTGTGSDSCSELNLETGNSFGKFKEYVFKQEQKVP